MATAKRSTRARTSRTATTARHSPARTSRTATVTRSSPAPTRPMVTPARSSPPRTRRTATARRSTRAPTRPPATAATRATAPPPRPPARPLPPPSSRTASRTVAATGLATSTSRPGTPRRDTRRSSPTVARRTPTKATRRDTRRTTSRPPTRAPRGRAELHAGGRPGRPGAARLLGQRVSRSANWPGLQGTEVHQEALEAVAGAARVPRAALNIAFAEYRSAGAAMCLSPRRRPPHRPKRQRPRHPPGPFRIPSLPSLEPPFVDGGPEGCHRPRASRCRSGSVRSDGGGCRT